MLYFLFICVELGCHLTAVSEICLRNEASTGTLNLT